MTFCAMGSNVILLHSGPWPFLFGLGVPSGFLHGKEGMVGVEGASLCKIEEIQKRMALKAKNVYNL